MSHSLARALTRGAELGARHVDAVAAATVFTVLLGIAVGWPDTPYMAGSWPLLWGVALAGAARLIQDALVWLAREVDPDRSDGDVLQQAVAAIEQARADLAEGADADSVRARLDDYGLLPCLGDLVSDLAEATSDHTGDLREQARLLYGAEAALSGR